MAKIKPILFNTEMVRAIQNGTKTATRRVVKPQPLLPYFHEVDGEWFWTSNNTDDDMMAWWPSYETGLRPPYHPGDILYVRETFKIDYLSNIPCSGRIHYKADDTYSDFAFSPERYEMMRRAQLKPGWRPNENMPREAARIFLRVADVRVERLQDITPEQIDAEGCKEWAYSAKTGELLPSGPSFFRIAWDKTIKPKDRALYSWDANPWVWVIEFEQCEKPEERKMI